MRKAESGVLGRGEVHDLAEAVEKGDHAVVEPSRMQKRAEREVPRTVEAVCRLADQVLDARE